MKRIVVVLTDREKYTLVCASRLVKGRNLSDYMRDILMDAATLELAQKKDDPK
jgi:hypothetical protein